MRKSWAVLAAALVVITLGAAPVAAKSNKPDGVPTGMWIDFCGHTYDLSAALGVIEPNSPDSFVNEEFSRIERSLRKDAAKIKPKNETFGKQVLALAKAVAKTRDDWDSTGHLKLRALSIAADPLPDC